MLFIFIKPGILWERPGGAKKKKKFIYHNWCCGCGVLKTEVDYGHILKVVFRAISLSFCNRLWSRRSEDMSDWDEYDWLKTGGVCYDPQRFMTESRSHLWERWIKPGIKTLLPFLKNIREESDLENFQDLIVALDACYWLNRAISISLSWFGDDQRCEIADFKRRFPASQKILSTV